MKHKIVPESLAERLALYAGKIPVPVVDALLPLVKARSLMAGVRLGIFEALRGAPLSPAALADGLGLDEASLRLLLRVLTAGGYLAARGDRYGLSALGRRSLIRGGAQECFGFLQFNYTQWQLLDHLEDLLRTGEGIDIHGRSNDAYDRGSYQRAMLEIARSHARILARHVPVQRGAALLLDLGGSHGLLGAAICRRHPPLRSQVIELPAALEAARRLAREEHVEDVVEHAPGDVRTCDLGTGADVILLANILHHLSPQAVVDVLRRARRALAPGGTLAVWDFDRRPETAAPDLGRDAIALFFHLTSTSRSFSAQELHDALAAAGFAPARPVRSPLAPLHVLVHGTLPACQKAT